jgi:hypothetical protein
MRRLRVLLGVFNETSAVDGSSSLNSAIINGLMERVDLYAIVFSRHPDSSSRKNLIVEPSFSQTVFNGVPALRIVAGKQLSFDVSESNRSLPAKHTRSIARAVADFSKVRQVDVVHVLQWLSLKAAFFEGAVLSGAKVFHTPYDYWAVCPTYYLRYQNRYNECSGPDATGFKCYKCKQIGTREGVDIHKSKRIRFMFDRIISLVLYNKPLMQFLGRRFHADFGYRYSQQLEVIQRIEATKRYYSKCYRILPMSSPWARKLSEITGVDRSKFHVCPPGALAIGKRLPKGSRYEPPLRIGHLHRTSNEGGTYFVLQAWASAGIPSHLGQLIIYAQPGGEQLIRDKGFSQLLDSGSVVVKEGRISDKMEEALMPLAAIVTGYQWEIGICGNTTASVFGIPTIASDWRLEGSEDDTFLREGINCIYYKKWDVESLSAKFKLVIGDPQILENLFDNFDMPGGFTFDDYMSRLLSYYEEVLVKTV